MDRWIRAGGLLVCGLFSGLVYAQQPVQFNHQADFVQALESGAVHQPLAQTVEIGAAELAVLVSAPVGRSLDLPQLTLGLSKQAGFTLKPVNIYASRAKVRVVDEMGSSTLPHSDRRFFVGTSRSGGVGFSLDPASGRVRGLLVESGESYTIEGGPTKSGGLALELRSLREVRRDGDFQCGNDHLEQDPQRIFETRAALPSLNAMEKGSGLLYEATVAIETDNELMWEKFGNNTSNARDWIEDLFVAMNAFYEPDLQMRLLLGDVFLRVDTSPAGDPDFNTDPAGFNDGLSEFSSYWQDNQSGVDRDFTALLSGKNVSSRSFSGVAWVTNRYCHPVYSNSFNRIGSNTSPSFIAGGVGHEIGHNLGSSHTHCEALGPGGAFVDNCYANEDVGCYEGVTACPAGDGTLMSYCHAGSSGFDGSGPAVGPPNRCSTSDTFHPLIAGKLSGYIAANHPSCIADFIDIGQVFVDGFE